LQRSPVRSDSVGLRRFELPTSRLSGVRSNQLSYRPSFCLQRHWAKEIALFAARYVCNLKGVRDREHAAVRFRPNLPSHSGRVRRLASATRSRLLLRKEVIQPHLPVRLPCYDFTPVTDLTLKPCVLSVRPGSLGTVGSHGVTGGVYKARERIQRGLLIRVY
jgi:hypothetical protein